MGLDNCVNNTLIIDNKINYVNLVQLPCNKSEGAENLLEDVNRGNRVITVTRVLAGCRGSIPVRATTFRVHLVLYPWT
jgi:hypothetical protein